MSTADEEADAIALWRIASSTPSWHADDLSGAGAEREGGRWNAAGTPMVYLATTRALACLETLVGMPRGGLPQNRILVEVRVPRAFWERRIVFPTEQSVGWDVVPAGLVSIAWGTEWAESGTSVLAEVPGVHVPEESNVLLNPRHPDAALIAAQAVRRWHYDGRFAR